MFLITTADQRFWKTDEPVLFLGEWCRIFEQRMVWQKMSHEVLPYHWNDRDRMFDDYQYVMALYESVLVDVSRWLNKIHGTERPVEYWRLVLGMWLIYFMQAFLDRYLSITAAANTGKVKDTLIGQYENNSYIPQDAIVFCDAVSEDHYNLFLYSWLIEHIKPFPYQIMAMQEAKDWQVATLAKSYSLRGMVERTIKIYEKKVAYKRNKFFMAGTFFLRKLNMGLQLSLGDWPTYSEPQRKIMPSKVNVALRQGFFLSKKENLFERLLEEIIPRQVPMSYLENYVDIKDWALQEYPRTPKVIVTAMELTFNDSFKIWAAEKRMGGTKVVGIQHGGAYGCSDYSCNEDHEIRITDRYFSWGWGSDNPEGKVIPISSPKLWVFKKKLGEHRGPDILIVLYNVPQYSNRMAGGFSDPMYYFSYLNNMFELIRTLDKSILTDLVLRLYPHDWGMSQESRFKEAIGEGIRFDRGQRSFARALRASKLLIATGNSTSYLESMASDFPTLLYGSVYDWKVPSKVQKYFDRLRKVGILHHSPQAAAQMIKEISQDPEAWWRGKEVQDAKNEFCHQFARSSDNWLGEWKRELQGVAEC